MPDLVKAALELQAERDAGRKSALAKQSQTTHPDFFIQGLTGRDGDPPHVEKTKKIAAIEKKLRFEAEADETPDTEGTVSKDAPSSAFLRGLASRMGDAPPLAVEEPRLRYIPKVDVPEGKVHHERDLDAHVPIWGTEQDLNPLGQLSHRYMTIDEAKAYREQEERKRKAMEQDPQWKAAEEEHQRNWAALKDLTKVADWTLERPLLTNQRKRTVAEASLRLDNYPVAGTDPEWRFDLWNGMEQTGANEEMRHYVQAEEQTEWANRQRASGKTEEEIRKMIVDAYAKEGIRYSERNAKNELTLSELESRRMDPDFFDKLTPRAWRLMTKKDHSDFPAGAMRMPSENALYAYLSVKSPLEQLIYSNLIDERLKRRLAKERAEDPEVRKNGMISAATEAAIHEVVRSLMMGYQIFHMKNTAPLPLTQAELDEEAYRTAEEPSSAHAIADGLSGAAEKGAEYALENIPIFGPIIGPFSAGGAAADEAARSGKSDQEVFDAFRKGLLEEALRGSTINYIVGSALPTNNWWQKGFSEVGEMALSDLFAYSSANERNHEDWKHDATEQWIDEDDPYPVFDQNDRVWNRR